MARNRFQNILDDASKRRPDMRASLEALAIRIEKSPNPFIHVAFEYFAKRAIESRDPDAIRKIEELNRKLGPYFSRGEIPRHWLMALYFAGAILVGISFYLQYR